MLIPMVTLAAIEAGRVTVAFRSWDRPRVKAGTRLRTTVGQVEVTSVAPIELKKITAADARRAGTSLAELTGFLAKRPEGQIYRIGLRFAGEDPRIALRNDNQLSDVEVAAIREKLAAMDRSAKRPPWTLYVLELIAQRPAVRAPDLAESMGWETQDFKRHVRRLKELGLTESLDVGYRLSPRGELILRSANR